MDYSNIKSKHESEARERAKRASDVAEAERQKEEQEQWHTIQTRRAEELLNERNEVKRTQEEILWAQKWVQQVEENIKRLNVERKAPQGWWDYFANWNKSAKARGEEKTGKELNILQNLASERIKLASHTRDRERLEQQKKGARGSYAEDGEAISSQKRKGDEVPARAARKRSCCKTGESAE